MIEDRPTSETALALVSAFRDGVRSPVDVIETSIGRIQDVDPTLGAVRTLAADRARAAAEDSARRWRKGTPRALEGIPVLVKDLFDTAGTPTSYGAAMFKGHEPVSDATAVRRIRDAGGIVLAKTATHEFGWGITTESAHFGATRNPWDIARSPGGSSGGSAAGLAAGYAPLALGSDTAGSIRVPSAFCGLVGLKPTFAAVDTEGLHPLVGSLDHAGPMAGTVDDLALLWSVLRTESTVPEPDSSTRSTVGVLEVSTGPLLSVGVADAYESAAAALAGAGHPTQPISSPVLTAAYGTLRDTVLAGGLATHRALGLWPARADEYGDDVRTRLELAERLDADAALRARAARTAVRRAMAEVFHAVDVLLSPVSATAPTVIGEQGEDYRDRVLTHIAPQSLAGLPALVVRAGFDDDGLPIGVQLTAPPGREDRLLDIGARFQRLTAGVQQRRPRLESHSTRTTTAGGNPCPSSTEATTSPCRSAVPRRTSTSTSVSSG